MVEQGNLIDELSQNPVMALEVIVQNNPTAVWQNLADKGIKVPNKHQDIFNAVAKLLNSGQKDAALEVLSVDVNPDNLPEGYYSEMRDAGYLQPEVDMSNRPSGMFDDGYNDMSDDEYSDVLNDLYDNHTGANDVTNGASSGSGKKSSFNWGDFFNFASDIVVGLWGTPGYNNPPPYYPEKKSNTGLYIGLGLGFVAIVVIVIVLFKKK